jgi:cell division protein FtsL
VNRRSERIQGPAAPSSELQKGFNMVGHFAPADIQVKRNIRTGIKIDNCRTKGGTSYFFTNRQIVLIALMLFIFMGSGIGYVWSNFEGTQICFDLSRLQQEELIIKEQNRKLKVELATLKSPEDLEKAAKELGLKEASLDQIMIIP